MGYEYNRIGSISGSSYPLVLINPSLLQVKVFFFFDYLESFRCTYPSGPNSEPEPAISFSKSKPDEDEYQSIQPCDQYSGS